MTVSTFDPVCFGQYPQDKVPHMLHFQYEGSEDVFRYVMVERIPFGQINTATRRKQGEGPDEDAIREQYINKERVKE
jgi:hypothetical protein